MAHACAALSELRAQPAASSIPNPPWSGGAAECPFLDSVSLAPPCAKWYIPKEFDSCGTWAHAARLVELESTPLDHSGKLSCCCYAFEKRRSMRALPSLFSASGQISSRLRSSTSLEARFPAAARNIPKRVVCPVSLSAPANLRGPAVARPFQRAHGKTKVAAQIPFSFFSRDALTAGRPPHKPATQARSPPVRAATWEFT